MTCRRADLCRVKPRIPTTRTSEKRCAAQPEPVRTVIDWTGLPDYVAALRGDRDLDAQRVQLHGMEC